MKNLKRCVGLVVCVAVLLGAFAVPAAANEVVFPTLVLAGSATITTVPDVASITFSIRTFNVDPIISQEQNRDRSNEIYAELAQIGITIRETRTQNYTLRRLYNNVRYEAQMQVQVPVYDNYGNRIGYRNELRTEHRNRQEFLGYETLHNILVTVNYVDYDPNLEIVGRVVDLSVSHGVTQFNGVSFSLSDAKRARVYTEALEEASQRINDRARAMMSTFGVHNIRPVTVNIENVHINVTRPATAPAPQAGAVMAPNMEADDANAQSRLGQTGGSGETHVNVTPSPIFTPISPGETTVTANVSVLFTY